MRIWLPYESFRDSARCMDDRTLTEQRFEVWRLLGIVSQEVHPSFMQDQTVRLWKPYPVWAAVLGKAICLEWESRHGRASEITKLFDKYFADIDVANLTQPYPAFLGDSLFHLSHRSCMIQLDPEHYRALWPGVIEGVDMYYPPSKGAEDGR